MTDTTAQQPNDHQASRPSSLSISGWKDVAVRVLQGIGNDHLSIISAGVAFFGFLAIFPAIAALIAIYGLIADPSHVVSSLEAVQPLLPPDVYQMISDQVDALVSAGRSALGVTTLVSILFALWSARAGVTALIEGLNIVYNERDDRNIIVQYLFSLGLTLVVIVMVIVALLTVVAIPATLRFFEFGVTGRVLAQGAPLLIMGMAVTLVIGAVYRYGPHRSTARKRWVTYGAVTATFIWLLMSVGLSIYISRFANFNQTYGSLGAIVGVLFWFYASAFAVLIGAEINANLELKTRRDTTTGPVRPMGERGAYVADNVV
ncbi:YihY/virulence factor BrkB family protein [Amaricoccus tamworthensis]|uniref:YihY/virulence factor BrkB family protein n=1 Tax=Amaricoccus tamworthensis TaxID=57002 RepID=UPI003C79EF7F